MKRPLGIVAILYGLGLLLAEFVQPSLIVLFGSSFALLVAAALLQKLRVWIVSLVIVLTGWTNLTYRTAILSPNDLRLIVSHPPEDVVIEGRLAHTPEERLYMVNGAESVRTLAEVHASGIKRAGEWHDVHGRILVTTQGRLQEPCFAGERVEIAGIIRSPKSEVAPGLFNYRAYLQRQGIHFELLSTPAEWTAASPKPTMPLSERFLDWAKKTTSRGLPEEDQPLRLLWAMTLGSRNVLTSEVYEPFVQSGTMHIFAISGLHIALIAGILVCVCRVLRIPRSWCGIVIIPLLWFYTGATGWQPSAVRSTVMMSIVIAGWSLKRPSDLLNSLSTAALIILVCDPQQLFQAGFQLSFVVVLSIALLLPPLEKLRDRWLAPDPMLPIDLVPRWQKWCGVPLRYLATGLATSIAAWIGAWPITAYYFHLFSPVTLLANLVMVPLSSAALASNLASLFCGAWFPWAGELFNHSAWFWMWLMMQTGVMSLRLPGAFSYVPSPAIADLFLYYGALIAILSGWALKASIRKWSAAGIAALLIFYGWRWHESRNSTDIVTLPFYGGTAIHCDAPGSASDLLVDCGNERGATAVVAPYLQAQGVNSLPRLALTHGDLHVMGGASTLLESMDVREVVSSSIRFRSGMYKELLANLQRSGITNRQVTGGARIGSWTVLHPPKAFEASQADDGALVLHGTFHGCCILLLSELGHAGQEALINSEADLRAQIVITGMPERGEPLRDALLDRIQPQLIVVTDSELPAHKRAKPQLKERLAIRGVPVLYTRESGAIRIRLTPSRWSVKTDALQFSGTSENHGPDFSSQTTRLNSRSIPSL